LFLLHRSRVLLGCALVAFGAGPALASMVTYMDTEVLARLSPVIVRGTVESIVSRSDAAHTEIHTDVTIRISESLKGGGGRDRIVLQLPGGSVDGHQSFVFGSPGFRKGEQVLVFAQPTKRGALTVTGLFQGKFRVESEGGVDVAVQEGAGDTGVVLRRGRKREDVRRPLAGLLDQVRDLVKRYPAREAALRAPAVAGPADALSSPDLGFTLRPLIPLRWFEPDSGIPVTMMFNPANAPTVVPGGARPQFEAAAQNWTNVTGSTIVMRDGGNTAAECWRTDGVSAVSHGDACGQFPDFDPVTCSGVLAVTGVANFTFESKVVNGVKFIRFREQDIVINGGTDCFFVDPGNYGEVIGHEMGHVTGLGHSCGDAFSPDCATDPVADAALMNAFAHGDGRGPTPQEGDINGVRFMYPPAGFVDAQLNGSSFTTGQALSLTADFNGTATADLYVFVTLPGGGFFALGAAAPNVLVPAASSLKLGFVVDAPLFTHTFTGSEAAGAYTWYALLVRPGLNPAQSANWLGIDSAPFTFTP
jgi:hypothetical protein